MLYSTKYFSPVGTIILAGDRDSIKGLWIEGQNISVKELPNMKKKTIFLFF